MTTERTKILTLKTVDDNNGLFEGYLSTYGNADRVGDVIDKGAFDNSIQKKSTVPMLFNHDRNSVIGKMELSSDDKGLKIKGTFNLNDSLAQNVYDLLKMGALDSMSIGMGVIEYEPLDKSHPFGAWRIKSADVFEGSVVTVPANELATIDAVKELNENERNELKTLRTKDRIAKVAGLLKECKELLTK